MAPVQALEESSGVVETVGSVQLGRQADGAVAHETERSERDRLLLGRDDVKTVVGRRVRRVEGDGGAVGVASQGEGPEGGSQGAVLPFGPWSLAATGRCVNVAPISPYSGEPSRWVLLGAHRRPQDDLRSGAGQPRT